MKSLIMILSLAFASIASAKSTCVVIEKDESGDYSRVVAQKTVEEGAAVALHTYGNVTVVAYVEGETTVLSLFDQSSNATTVAAFGNGATTGFLNAQAGYGAVCQRP